MTYGTGSELYPEGSTLPPAGSRPRLGRQFWYIVAKHGNRLVIIGPKDTEQEAQDYGWQKLEVEFEVVGLATRDRSRAAAQIKARQLDTTGDLGGAIQRSMRKPPEDYNRSWWGEE